MRSLPIRVLLLAGSASFLLSLPALGQDRPESLLPPGFGDPTPPPAALRPAPEEPKEAPSGPEPAPTPAVRPAPLVLPPSPPPSDSARADLEQLAVAPPPNPFAVPEELRRATDVVGVLTPDNGGLGYDAWGRANGAMLAGFMRRLDAPLPSRWTSMLLRRALLSRAPAPSLVAPVGWVAERAGLLLRMGEADAARMLVQQVDVEDHTPRFVQVALETALATANPAGLCPLVGPGSASSDAPIWPLAEAICAALEGEAARASQLIDRARRRSRGTGADLLLAEKVVGAGTNSRRAVTLEWDEVDRLNAWRFGLASATGLEIPDRLFDGAGANMRAWYARAPMVPLDQRLEAAAAAAALGVFSSANMIEIYSLLLDAVDPAEAADTVGARLRQAYLAASPSKRLEALRAIWSGGETPVERYARLILTAGAASRIPPSPDFADSADDLVAAMLSAGMDRRAARWASVVGGDGAEERDRAWALLALGAPRPVVDLDSSRIEAFRSRDSSPRNLRTRMLVAALAGLGRIDGQLASSWAQDLGIPLGRETRWSRLLAAAARSGQPGTVALLSGVGMQTGGWSGVPPEHLFHILRALRAVGHEFEARMIAAEALTRL